MGNKWAPVGTVDVSQLWFPLSLGYNLLYWTSWSPNTACEALGSCRLQNPAQPGASRTEVEPGDAGHSALELLGWAFLIKYQPGDPRSAR